MKNIVFITIGIGFGGAEKMLCFIANQLSLRGHAVSIINLNAGPEHVNVKTQILEPTVQIYQVRTSGKKVIKRLGQIYQTFQYAKQCRADVVIGFLSMPNFIAKLVGALLHIPSIVCERGDPNKTFSSSLGGRLILHQINRATGAVFQTEGAKQFYKESLQKRGVVIANPVFVQEDIPAVSHALREKTIVSVGRFEMFQKRYDVMLKAFALFSKKHPEYVLKLYGNGDDLEQIKSIISNLQLESTVRLMGVSQNPMQDIAKDGMFVITSDFEGIPNALLEAMAAGLPCIATDCTPGGARMLITDHENGLLVPIRDSEQIAAAMCEFAENATLAEQCGINARNVLTRFAPAKIIDEWEQYICDIIDRKIATK